VAGAAVSTRGFSAGGSATVSVQGMQSILNRISNTFSNAFSAGSVLSARFTSVQSTVSHLASIVSNVSAQSAGGSATGLQNVVNLLSNKISHEESVRSAAVEALGNGLSDANANLAIVAPWQEAKIITMSSGQSIAASALTDLSGMVLTVGADQTWKFEGMMLVSTSSPTAGLRLGFSVPPLSLPRLVVIDAVSGNGQSVGGVRAGAQLQVSGNSIILSMTSSNWGGAVPVQFEGIFNTTSSGTFRVMAANVGSATGSPNHYVGGYMIAYRLK
jgi:hypothetical protein